MSAEAMRMKPIKRIVMKESMFKQREVKVCEEGRWVVKFVRLGFVLGQKLIRDWVLSLDRSLSVMCKACVQLAAVGEERRAYPLMMNPHWSIQ